MTAAVVHLADTGRGDGLLAGYDTFVDGLMVSAGQRWARRRAARRFLDEHPDLAAWMELPTPTRLRDLQRGKGWPFLSWCLVEGHLHADLELLLAKPGGCELPRTWRARHPEDVAAVDEAGGLLGWSTNWNRQVTLLFLPILCLWAGKPLAGLDDGDFDAFLVELDDVAHVSFSACDHARKRLFGLSPGLLPAAAARPSPPHGWAGVTHRCRACRRHRPARDPSRGRALRHHAGNDPETGQRRRARQDPDGVLRLAR